MNIYENEGWVYLYEYQLGNTIMKVYRNPETQEEVEVSDNGTFTRFS